MNPPPVVRRVRLCYFNTWAKGLEDAASFVARIPSIDLKPLVSDPHNEALLAMARLDCDWYGENARVLSTVSREGLEFLPAWVCGTTGIAELGGARREEGEERWLVTMGHQPQALGAVAGKAFSLLSRTGVRHLFYGFDEASRFMPCFNEIAPHLDILIHDEEPLAGPGKALLRPRCRTIHRSWVANLRPFAVPFNEEPEDKILFLGSKLGLTPHRERQIRFLRGKFKDRFVAIHDHSVGVAERASLNRYKVGLCPEGRKFTTAPMARTHTDRPFWSGCCGIVPVAEDSRQGGRLEELSRGGLIERYAHGDLPGLAVACERALAASAAQRRTIYEHFNASETVGTVVADALFAAN
jgi:hypothetical protein